MKQKNENPAQHRTPNLDEDSGEVARLRRFYTKNRIPIILLCAALIVFGIISLFYLDVHLVPDIEYPELVVVTHYPNATPEEVKNLVTIPVEQSAVSMKGVRSVSTLSQNGLSIVRVHYRWGEDLSVSHIELREKLDILKSFFPKEVQRPIIINYQTSQEPVEGIAVTSGTLDDRSLYLFCKKDILPAVEKTEGVARVEVQGGESPEIRVVVEPKALVKYGVGVPEIRSAVQGANKNFGVGFFQEGDYEYLIRVDGEVDEYGELEGIVVKEEGKKLVFLGDVASVQYTAEERQSGVLIDGESALMLSLYRRPAYSILGVSRRIDEAIGQLEERYRGSISFHKLFDESMYVKDSLRELVLAMAFGIIFTALSVWVFLRNMRVSLIIILTLPMSIVATFIIMNMAGISINLLTLGGFSLAIGMMVDNAVIVVTGVFEWLHRREKGDAFYHGLRMIVPAVVSATFTTVVVFFPVMFLTGVLKLIFLQLSLIIVVALLFSLLFAVFLVPLLLSRLKINPRGNTRYARGGGVPERVYNFVLSSVMKMKAPFLFALAAVICLGALSYGAIDKRFVESMPQNYFFLRIFIKRQVPFSYTARFTGYVSELLRRDERIERIIAEMGADPGDVRRNLDGLYGSNTAVLKVYTSLSGVAIYPLLESIRKRLEIFSDVDFLVDIPDNPLQRLLLRSDFDACIRLYDPSSEVLVEKVQEVQSFLESCDFSYDVMSSYYMPHREQALEPKREELAIYRVDTVPQNLPKYSMGIFSICFLL